jgi:UDP-N-acetylglucosamine:LPS N-acetylglucosamine transferase
VIKLPMLKGKKILVLTDHMPWGHRSIAKAIYGFLKEKERKEGFKVIYEEVKAETGFLGEVYQLSYRYFPKSNIIAHKLMDRPALRRMSEEASIINLPRLKRLVQWTKPDLIISTYFFHSHSLSKWLRKNEMKIDLWTVVADPWTINALSAVRGANKHIVYDQKSAKIVEDLGIDKKNILVSGWWVRKEMYEKYEVEKIKKKLGIAKDGRPIIFVGGGSLGSAALSRILPGLMFVDKKVTVIFNSGTDKLSRSMVNEYTKMLKKIRRDDLVEVKNLGWIDNMAEVLGMCDIVFGKAGPNFLFDVVASGKPFVAITHIGGQEDGNIELIEEKKLGWVKEKNGQAIKFLMEYLENPNKFNDKYKKEILLEADRNKKSLELIYREIETWALTG